MHAPLCLSHVILRHHFMNERCVLYTAIERKNKKIDFAHCTCTLLYLKVFHEEKINVCDKELMLSGSSCKYLEMLIGYVEKMFWYVDWVGNHRLKIFKCESFTDQDLVYIPVWELHMCCVLVSSLFIFWTFCTWSCFWTFCTVPLSISLLSL